jgi:hypothetical protein
MDEGRGTRARAQRTLRGVGMGLPRRGGGEVRQDARGTCRLPLRRAGDFREPPPWQHGRSPRGNARHCQEEQHCHQRQGGWRGRHGKLEVLECPRGVLVGRGSRVATGRPVRRAGVLHPAAIPTLVKQRLSVRNDGVGQRPEAESPEKEQKPDGCRAEAALLLGGGRRGGHVGSITWRSRQRMQLKPAFARRWRTVPSK